MPTVFRDPSLHEAPTADAAALAAVLLDLPQLPAPTAFAPLWLHAISRVGSALHLQVGATRDTGTLTLVMTRGEADQPLRVEVRGGPSGELGPALGRLSRQLAGLPAERVDAAWALAGGHSTSARDLPLGYFRQLVPGVRDPIGLVRTGFRCNQDCGFCWQDRRWGGFGEAQIRVWIEDLAAAGARNLLISGGEPTLDPALAGYIALARSCGIAQVGLETNAVQLAKPGKVEALVEAGLGHALVSLHSTDAATSDALTRAPGTFVKTIEGLRRLIAADLPIDVNTMLTRRSVPGLDAMPDFLAQLAGPRLQRVSWTVSMPSQPFAQLPDDDLAQVSPLTVRATLASTIAAARRVGLRMQGSEGPCGPPLCAFGGDPWVVDRSRRVDPVDFRTFLPACDACALRPACLGVRREDVLRWGDAAVAPLTDAQLAST